MRWRSMVAAACALAACALAVCACGSGGEEATDASPTTARDAAPSSSTTTTVSTTTTTAPLTDEELVVQTVEEMWLMLKTVGAAPDPASPELERYLTSPQLEKAQASMAEWQQKGYVVQAGPEDRWEHRASLVELNGDAAIVEDCGIDDTWLVAPPRDGSPGQLVNGDQVVELWRAELVREDGSWRVANLERLDAWFSGDLGCASSW